MKKLGIIMIVAGMAAMVACHLGRKHTTIVETGNNHYLRIEYAGHVAFNQDGTEISSISRDGYVEYQNNEKKLNAKNNGHGGVSYELYDGYAKVNLDDNGKKFIAEAVNVMLQKTGRNPNTK
ncbi:MAG: hypothetical protein ACXVB0_17045 [Mucilaginibacter sp.]